MMTLHPPPAHLAGELRALTARQLSMPSKMRYVVLLLAAAIMTAVVAALWLTEPSLPRRTSIAFGVLIIAGASWVAFAGWVLARRRVLLGHDRVIASRLALAFSGVFAAGSGVLGVTTGQPGAMGATAIGLAMVAAAVVLWMRARAAFAKLSARRDRLMRELGGLR